MTVLSDGLARLIEPWTMEVPVGEGKRVQHFPPLVDMLRAMVVPSMNSRGGGGAVSTRNLIDPAAFDLLGLMEDVTRAWLGVWRVRAAGELKLDLRGFWDALHNPSVRETLTDTEVDNLTALPDRWAAQIWDLNEPPKLVPLRGVECPVCGAGRVTNAEGEVSPALLVTLRVGHAFTTECRAAGCTATWVGETGLVELGRATGQDIDFDTLVKTIAEMSARGV